MGQKVNPIGFRTGIMEGWKSRWYASKQEFKELLIEDHRIRKFIHDKYKFAGIPKVEIERTRDEVKVVLFTARPGVIIGRKGQEVERLQEELQQLLGRRINIKIEEISRPEIYAQLVAEDIAEQLAKRASFRRTMKRAVETSMEAGAKGIKIQLAGRWGGPKWPAAKSRSPARCRFRRCGRRSITVSLRQPPPRETLAFKCGLTKGCTRTKPMALMPKRVKHRKSQRGRIRGDATRGNRVVFGEFGLQAAQAGWLRRRRSRPAASRRSSICAPKGGCTSACSRTSRSRPSRWKREWAKAKGSRSFGRRW